MTWTICPEMSGIGVDLLVLEGPHAQRDEQAGQRQDQPALAQGQADQGGNHRPALPPERSWPSVAAEASAVA